MFYFIKMVLEKEILIPNNVQIENLTNFITLKGPLGCVILKKKNFITVSYDKVLGKILLTFNKKSILKNKIDSLEKKFYDYNIQLNRSLKSVSFNFFLQLKLVGIGYRFISFNNSILKFRVGYCNIIEFKIPKNVNVVLQNATIITLYSNDLLCLKQVSTSLRKVRGLDNYKGKGILYLNETPILKENNKKQL